MKTIAILILCVVSFEVVASGTWDIPDPLAAITDVEKKVVEQAAPVANGFVSGVQEVAHVAQKAEHKVVKGTKTVGGKINNGIFDVEKGFVNGLQEVVGTPVDLNDLTFWLVSSKNIENPTKIDFYKPDEVANTTGKIFFIIHGWQSSRNASWFHDLSTILILRHPDTHVVQVNWDKPASENYPFAAFSTESAGNFIGILVNKLVKEYKIPKENIILIGHSLGGQISGWAGKKFKEMNGEKLARIIALDPAGPLFILRPDSRRLNKHDADVVMVIHTDADKLGFPSACGTIDFFPNGGDNQPGCWTVDLAKVSSYVEPVTCDHSRAWDFFVEAVNSTGSFPSRRCKSFDDFRNNICEAIEGLMGDLGITHTGSFFLETHPERSYSKLLPKLIEKVKDKVEDIKEKLDGAQKHSEDNKGNITKSS